MKQTTTPRFTTCMTGLVALALAGCGGEAIGDRDAPSDRPGANGAPGNGGDDGGDDGDDCTLTQGYWKNHASGGNAKDIPWPISEDTELCGQTWLDILWTPTDGDAWYILAHQWIAAELNVANGATPAPEVADALDAAEVLLLECEIAADDRDDAITYSELLDDFNNGLGDTGHCDDGDDGDDGGDDGDDGGDDGDGGSDGGDDGDTGGDCVDDPEGIDDCDPPDGPTPQ